MRNIKSHLAGLAVALLGSAPAVAHADVPTGLAVDVTKVIESSLVWIESRANPAKAAQPFDRLSLTPPDKDKTGLEARPNLKPPVRFSLVARDWGSAHGITGEKAATDDLRLSRSSRMLVGRARLELGAFQPFAHVALGEWRYDPNLLTLFQQNKEYATQLAAGFELKVAKHAKLGVELDYTILCRESREPQNLPTPYVLGGYGVFRANF